MATRVGNSNTSSTTSFDINAGGDAFAAAVGLVQQSNTQRVAAESAMAASAAQASTQSTALGMELDNKFTANNMARTINNALNKAAIDGINKAAQNA